MTTRRIEQHEAGRCYLGNIVTQTTWTHFLIFQNRESFKRTSLPTVMIDFILPVTALVEANLIDHLIDSTE